MQLLIDKCNKLWDTCTVRPEKLTSVASTAHRMILNKDKYLRVQAIIACPWFIVACIHNLEGSLNFNTQLLNGELWTKKTTLVPAGRGPWESWEESTIEALRSMQNIMSYTIPQLLEKCEKHNGLGYLRRGVNSPYIWSMTNQYDKGKYVADGVYDPFAVSKQVGVAAIIRYLLDNKHIV